MSDCTSIYLSGIAIWISLLSLGWSGYIGYRDRSHVTASARYPKRFKNVFIYAVNSGRRPITLRQLIIETQDSTRYEYPLLKEDAPLRLMESEGHEFSLFLNEAEVQQIAKTKIRIAELEDSRGKRYTVEDLAKLIDEYAADQTMSI